VGLEFADILYIVLKLNTKYFGITYTSKVNYFRAVAVIEFYVISK
jgi:hypothetical protein